MQYICMPNLPLLLLHLLYSSCCKNHERGVLRLRAAAHRPAGHDLLQKGAAAAYRAYSYMYMAQAAQTNDLQHVLRISYF